MEELNSEQLSCKRDSQHDQDHLQSSQFIKSLKELKDLRSQLHYAADYCEKSFLKAKQKKRVVESTKEYVCRAVVAVVDHLGCVSANLTTTISNKASGLTEAELRIDALKQRFLMYELYAQKVALTRTRWCFNLPKSARRYLSIPNIVSAEKPADEDIRDTSSVAARKKGDDNKLVLEAEDLPLFLYTYAHKASPADANFSAVAVRDAITVCGKGSTPTFHFQERGIQHQRHGRRRLSGRSSGDIMSLIRRSKRPA